MTPTNASTHPDHPPPEACQISPPAREADTSPPNALLTNAGSRAETNHHVYILQASVPSGATAIAHRYSALRTLHHTLAALGPMPPFPAPKRLFKRAAWVVREREVLLQRFLDDCESAAARSPATRDALATVFGLAAPPARDALAAFVGLPKATAVEPAAAPEVAPTAAPAPAPSPATERSLPAEARFDAERRRAAEAYASAASLWAALRDGQAILLRATWLLRRAGFEEGEVEVMATGKKAPGWVARRAASALPHRAQIEADFPGAIMPVEECEAAHARLREMAARVTERYKPEYKEAERAQLDAAPVLVLSHCWEGPDHPDPEARTLRALAEALAGTWGSDLSGRPRPESGLPLYRAWGLADVGVFVDWASLYQDKPAGVRTAEQTACFKRALGNMSLW